MDVMTFISTVVSSVLASGGLWTWMSSRRDRKSASNKLIVGIGRTEIVKQGMAFCRRGWISKDEYDDFMEYFAEPYFAMGGNGLAQRIVKDVTNLPIQSRRPTTEELEIIARGL